MIRWIKTSDKLPEDFEIVETILSSGQCQKMYYSKGVWLIPNRPGVYWLPLWWRPIDPVTDHGPELLEQLSYMIAQVDHFRDRGFGVASMIDIDDARELLKKMGVKL